MPHIRFVLLFVNKWKRTDLSERIWWNMMVYVLIAQFECFNEYIIMYLAGKYAIDHTLLKIMLRLNYITKYDKIHILKCWSLINCQSSFF